ncbi:MAG: hypothetical protein ACD_59C00131G0002 [uncultured bacterium]|nr:MAG: hypothetical protein ACD_59C00131G0002 [uncultured bacterium]
MDNDKKHYHDKGQQDAADGIFENPHGVLNILFTPSPEETDHKFEDNKAYGIGHASATAQKDEENETFNPPSDPDERKAYEDSWNGAHDNKQ